MSDKETVFQCIEREVNQLAEPDRKLVMDIAIDIEHLATFRGRAGILALAYVGAKLSSAD